MRRSRRTPEAPAQLRLLCASNRPTVRAAALRALGPLADLETAGLFLEGLADPEPDVRRAAQAALETASRSTAHGSVADWRRWLAEERAFWDEHREELREELACQDAARVSRAARALLRHPIQSHWLGLRLSEALPSLEGPAVPGLARLASRTLSCQAVPGLIDLAFRSDPRLRVAVGSALRELTGEDLPDEGSLWERWANR